MKRFFYHGTSADNLERILKNGLSCNENKLWNVSNDYIYLWCPEAVGKEWECEDKNECEERAFQMAFESAQFACACAKDCRAVVLKIELDERESFPDKSSDNMEGMGSVCIDRDIELHEIKEIKISNDLSLLKGYFLSLAAANEFSIIELSKIEKRIADIFTKSMGIYPEDIEDLTQWEVIEHSLQTV